MGQPFDVQIQQGIHQPAGVNAGAHIADTVLFIKKRIIHGKNHAAGSRRFHDAQVRELRISQNGILEGLQRFAGSGGYADGILRGMSQDICGWCCNV